LFLNILGANKSPSNEKDTLSSSSNIKKSTNKLYSPLKNVKFPKNNFGINRPGLDKPGKTHPGIDLTAASGTEVYSPQNGVVIDSSIRNDACGGTLYIDHKNGYKSRFCHLKQIDVKKGDIVKQGQQVALTGGASGDVGKGRSTGAHLHYELYLNNKLIDPMGNVDMNSKIGVDGENDKKDFLKNTDEEEIKKIKEKIFDFNPSLKNNDKSELLNKIEETNFFKNFQKILKDTPSIKENSQLIEEDETIKIIQIALQFLEYLDVNYGIDGFYDEKTKDAILSFKKDFDLSENNDLDKIELLTLYYLTLLNLFDDTKYTTIKFEPNYKNLKLFSLNNFYEMVLIGIKANITYNNLSFLQAWNDATTLGGENNPFGLDFGKNSEKNSPLQNTINTLMKQKYDCVRFGLIKNLKKEEIVKCDIFIVDNLKNKILDIINNQ